MFKLVGVGGKATAVLRTDRVDFRARATWGGASRPAWAAGELAVGLVGLGPCSALTFAAGSHSPTSPPSLHHVVPVLPLLHPRRCSPPLDALLPSCCLRCRWSSSCSRARCVPPSAMLTVDTVRNFSGSCATTASFRSNPLYTAHMATHFFVRPLSL